VNINQNNVRREVNVPSILVFKGRSLEENTSGPLCIISTNGFDQRIMVVILNR
jgi:hypothetical protein